MYEDINVENYCEILLDLHWAITSGDVEITRKLIHDFDLSSPQHKAFARILLFCAIWSKQTEIVRLLVSAGTAVNYDDSIMPNTERVISPLYAAALKGSIEIVEILLDNGANIDAETEFCETSLLRFRKFAIFKDYQRIAELLITGNANINFHTDAGTKLLHSAIKTENRRIVKMLLQRGAAVDAVDSSGDNALFHAIRCGNLTIIEDVLKLYPDLNSPVTKQFVTSWCLLLGRDARQTKNREIVKLLVDHGFTVDANDANNPSFVRAVVMIGNIELLRDTLNHVRDVNAPQFPDPQLGYTLVQLAFENENLDVAVALLERGADVDAQDVRGKSLVEWLVEENYADGFKLLLDRGLNVTKYPSLIFVAAKASSCKIIDILSVHPNVDVNVADLKGNTALHYVKKGKIARTLLRNGAIANARDPIGETPLHVAVSGRYDSVVEALLEHGADVNIRAARDATPLVHCAFVNSEDCGPYMTDDEGERIAQMLLDRGADVNVRFGGDRRTMLHEASSIGYESLVRILLKHVAKPNCPLVDEDDDATQPKIDAAFVGPFVDVDASDKNGRTALHVALMVGFPCIAMMLIDHGADIDLKCDQGLSALDYASEDHEYDSTGIWYHASRNAVEKQFHEAMLKIKASGKHLSARNVRALESSKWEDEWSDFYADCEAEIARMKTEKIDCKNLSLYDLLTMDANHLAFCAKNECVASTLGTLNSEEMYPIYYDKIDANFVAARNRNIWLGPSVRSFNELFADNDLPDCMVLEILSYLSNKDLKNMIKACYGLNQN